MKEEEIIQNNKLIAEFMGDIKSQDDKVSFTKNCVPAEFKYHSSWDWLMPVVEKIEGLGFEVLIGRISCNINRILDRENPITSFVCGDISKKREIVYDAIVQFINWYNKNK